MTWSPRAVKAAKQAAKDMMSGANMVLGDLVHSSDQYEIPAFQRGYQWDAERWQDLIGDIVRSATASPKSVGAADPYWIGIMIVSITPTPGGGISEHTLRVIDGQQRLVTLLCWIRALQDYAADHGLPVPGEDKGLVSLRVQEQDRASMDVVMKGTWREAENHHLLNEGPLAAYVYFRMLLHQGDVALVSATPLKRPSFGDPAGGTQTDPLAVIQQHPAGPTHDPEDLYDATVNGISIFGMKYVSSDKAEAGLFDALNGRRTELEPLDYMRSTLFVRLGDADASRIYETHWKPREEALYKVKLQGVQPGRNFPYDFLICLGNPLTSDGVSAGRAHIAFTRLLAHHDYNADWLRKLVLDDLLPAMTAWPVVVGQASSILRKNGQQHEVPSALLRLMQSIFSMSRQPMNPLVLHIVCAWNRGAMTQAEAAAALGMAESYVARWIMAGWRLNNLRADVMAVMARLRGSTELAAIEAALRNGQWATNTEILDGIEERDFYGSGGQRAQAVGAILTGIERAESGGEWPSFRIGKGAKDYNVEHIYPQKPATWAADLRRWRQKRDVMDERVNSLGNLTVVTAQHNKKVKNKTLKLKQEEASLLKAPMLHINTDWMDAERWTKKSIDQRTMTLARIALEHWARPGS